jgi:shikimate kinase/3-dehydroquinate synthase
MGSGKSTVASLLASRLGWTFLDFDAEIARRAGASVPEIFESRGEQFFRALEAEVGRELLGVEGAVLASGGGWPVPPGRMEELDGSTLSVWLAVEARTAVERVRWSGELRPLLQTADPVGRAETLLRERTPRYRLATLHLDSERASPAELVEQVLKHMASQRDVAAP